MAKPKYNQNHLNPNQIDTCMPQVTDNDNELVLVKNGQRYVFHCDPGAETDLLNQLATMVSDPTSGLDWFDAAVLSHQMGERMIKRIKNLRKS